MENNRNFFITIALSVLILTLWQVFYMNPKMEQQREAARIEQQRVEAQKKDAGTANSGAASTQAPAPGAIPNAPGGEAVTAASRDQAIAATKRIRIDTPSLEGSINLTGARLDDIKLKHYTETVDKNSPEIQLLNPQALPTGYFAEIGFVGSDKTGTVPGADTVWSVDGNPTLTASSPVTLTFTNDKGLTFKRTISVDNDYMFTVSDTVQNSGTAAVSLFNYGRVTRYDKPAVASTYVLHEGLIGVTGTEGLTEYKYAAIEKDKEVKPGKSTDGWLGITDKYWAVTLVPTEKQPFQPRYGFFEDGRHRYQSDFLTDAINVDAGQSATVETEIFAGAKEVAKINAYEADRHIRQFNLLIDWGWFYFITKPMFWLIDTLYKFFGNFGLAILATTVIVKAIFFPLANKSYASMANMKKVQPKMLEIREKYADDKMKQQQAMMELYKTEKINPLAGCWPVALQIPVFFSLYKVLYITIEMRHAPFFGWIHDLAAPDPTSVFNLFGLLPFAAPAFLPHMGAWAVVMGITMFLQMRMNPAPPDPTQAMIFTWMPVVFTFMMGSFPAGLVIYWAWNNLLSILQQGVIMKRQGAKIELWDNLAAIFRKKPSPAE
ncbi:MULTISPECIES: membrane protein insertase YidC [unclassified Mesorhizobium]|uniref:membrane protein insertase YidC n=1 Tax=unclassified Mesorhizobium TaxID=325217 RepID=UPI000BB07C2D|nr:MULTISPECIES: membrane protein insertase YidC [unclassified Mesorhizobium]TGT60532.1 membrane protein insertase YidC [Mesorhizobium sp. M00.F.Ca.ET.170.01.1.1]AZO10365.1 membrane protein insertase YidC [Mesorhizobium sp. M3A.F.Ca.ET.080.04.2.1]PBB87889.1 membrane protein insertase YidC [Mesorhizobium sp. WSM3876]RWB73639.1 MAG: membrane protein insertase YidC [Mesorhizobium sp.]RWB91804.1 MAG: membrane protein insertase YidC [Mesorhizobium sp.]